MDMKQRESDDSEAVFWNVCSDLPEPKWYDGTSGSLKKKKFKFMYEWTIHYHTFQNRYFQT